MYVIKHAFIWFMFVPATLMFQSLSGLINLCLLVVRNLTQLTLLMSYYYHLMYVVSVCVCVCVCAVVQVVFFVGPRAGLY